MSGSPENNLKLSHKIRLIETHANRLITDLEQQKPAALLRLVQLEKAFHLWKSSFHIIASTAFDYYRLEKAIEVLLEGSLVNPLTAKRKAETRNLPRRYDTSGDSPIVVWLFEDESDIDLETDPAALPQVAQAFLDDMRATEGFARHVAQLVKKQDDTAKIRVRTLEVAFYLLKPYEDRVASPSFRLSYFKQLCRQLGKNSPKQ